VWKEVVRNSSRRQKARKGKYREALHILSCCTIL
jgi:hypothetical protein